MIPISNTLLRCSLFDGIAADDLQGMLNCLGARQMAYAKGEVILAEGEPARDMGVLLAGQVQLIRTDYYGNRSIMLAIGPGELFGESYACAMADHLPVSVVAGENCEVMFIDCRRLLTVCSHACSFHSQLIFNLLKIVANKNIALNQRAQITSRRTTREKLLSYLHQQAKQAGSPRFCIPFDRQELADYLEVDRSGLSAEMSKLKKEGVLDYYKNSFYLLRQIHA